MLSSFRKSAFSTYNELNCAVVSPATALFVAIYLLTRGLIKVGLVWGLLQGKLMAYPLSLGVLLLLVFYQIYQLLTPPFSLTVFGITVFDLFVMYFVYREWKIVLRHQKKSAQAF